LHISSTAHTRMNNCFLRCSDGLLNSCGSLIKKRHKQDFKSTQIISNTSCIGRWSSAKFTASGRVLLILRVCNVQSLLWSDRTWLLYVMEERCSSKNAQSSHLHVNDSLKNYLLINDVHCIRHFRLWLRPRTCYSVPYSVSWYKMHHNQKVILTRRTHSPGELVPQRCRLC
jgi:hypothetical protein